MRALRSAAWAKWRDGRGRSLPRLTLSCDGIGVRVTKVWLLTAHLDHNTTNNPPHNLKALCQRCHMIHMIHDRPEHRRRRWLTLRMRKAIGDLISGLYRL